MPRLHAKMGWYGKTLGTPWLLHSRVLGYEMPPQDLLWSILVHDGI
ncbi:hypothetical protein KFU94_60935 [Chloroflexi bacterium TSY]|nr:hypothetical protein [Chloroflexi bacterium TSY]